MKKLVLIFAVVPAFSLYGTYKEVKEGFISQLYARQSELLRRMGLKEKRLVNEGDFKAFVEPYLKEAEKKLAIASYFAQNDDSSPLCEEYFKAFLDYINAAFFRENVKNYLTQYNLASARTLLSQTIAKVQEKIPETASIERQKELEATIKIATRIAHAYIQQLTLRDRAVLFVKRATLAIKRPQG